MTTRSLGTAGSYRAPVELTIIFSSKGNPGNAVASLPVAMMMFLAETTYFLLSSVLTYLDRK